MVRPRMRGFIDLHCHWVAGVDDGAETTADSLAMLTELHRIGFDAVAQTHRELEDGGLDGKVVLIPD